MIRFTLLIICFLISNFTFTQPTNNTAIEKLVNEQVWKPFKAAWEGRDWQKFNALHTDDVLRVSKWGIKTGSTYKASNKQSFQKKDARQRSIDFCLEHRIYGENIGYEVGYYRIISKAENKEEKRHYAQFHVVLKKIDGQWKIAQDWDTDEINGVKVVDADFAKRKMLDLEIKD